MIKVGDTVKVIGKTVVFDADNGREIEIELVPIGTICTVTDFVEEHSDYHVVPKDSFIEHGYWYYADALEKGHMEWIRDE